MSNRKPAGPATKSKNRRLFQVATVTTLCCLALVGQALPQIVENPITGHRYEYVRLRGFFYWDQAQEMAVSRGGYLATVTDSIESRLIAGLLAFPGQKAFLGATDYLDSCMWTWVTGEPWIYQNWAPGEPGGEEPCINSLRTSFELGGKWDADVGPLDGFIIEWNAPSNDTLLNLQQWPVSEGGNGHWYAYLPQAMSWDQARIVAGQFEQFGTTGHLASVSDEAENSFIHRVILTDQAFPDGRQGNHWLGGYDDSLWTWVTGEPFVYTNWGFGEPQGNRMAMVGTPAMGCPMCPQPGEWLGLPNEIPLGSIIEFDTPADTTGLLSLMQWPVSEGGNGHWYAFLPSLLTWDQARQTATQFTKNGVPGHLATVTSQEENDFVLYHLLLSMNPQEIPRDWLGGFKDSTEDWVWITGEPFSYANWGLWFGADPERVGPGCAIAMSSDSCVECSNPGYWLTDPPNAPYSSIIEFDTEPQTDTLLYLTQWPVSEGGNGHWYAYLPAKLPWEQARRAAGRFAVDGVPGHLATITTPQENDFAFRTVSFDPTNPMGRVGHHWLGGFDDSLWVWITGEQMIYTNWAFGQPSPIFYGALAMVGPPWMDCALCPQPGEWFAHQRDTALGAIVEFDTEPVIDTLVDLVQWPVSEGGNGHWYAYLPSYLSWEQARSAAAQLEHNGIPGHLATITSEPENTFVFENIVDAGGMFFRIQSWLGGHNDPRWTWVTGESFDYTRWGYGHPGDSIYSLAVAMVGPPWFFCIECPHPGDWVSMPRNLEFPSIVEFDAPPIEPRVLCVPSEYPTIQSAINAAWDDDVVLVSPGVYEESINFLGKRIAVRSAKGPMHTVITNQRTVNLVTFDHGETRQTSLEGFTLMGGWMAVLCARSGPTIAHNICVGQNVWNWAAIGLCGSYIDVGDPSGDPRISARVGPAPATLINNTIVMSANGGISSFSSEPPSFRNNIVAFNTNYGIHQQDPFSQPQPILGFNDVFGNGVDSPYPYGDYINIPDPGPGSISADPLFSPDFSPTWTLTAESPCIDAGDPNPRFNDPDGSRNDMGALPFMGGPGGGVIPTNQWVVVFCEGLDTLIITEPGSASILQAFDPSGILCGQTLVWLDRSYLMPVYGDDPYTDIDEGCVAGDLIQFHIDGIPVQPALPVYWTANGDTFEVCDFGYAHCLDIPLHTGWNLVSWNVAYEAPIRLALDEIIGCVDVVVSFEQGGLVFDPNLDGFNTLTNVDYHHGYWIRMNCDAVLQVCGDPIGPDQAIGLELGWNLVSYWPELSFPTETGFVTILDHLQEAMGFDNSAQIWLPGMGHLNTLTELRPGFGYWAKVTEAGALTYPPFGGGPLFDTVFIDTSFNLPGPGIPETAGLTETSRSWMSVYGGNITVDGESLSDGAVLSFRTDESVVCGSGVYQNGALRFTPVYGHDQSGGVSKSYPVEGDQLAVYVNDQRVYPDVTWSSDGARVRLSRLTTDSRGLPQAFELAQNYPNPFNPGTMVAFEVPVDGHVNIAIFNVLGQQVRTLTNRDYVVGRYELEWNGRDDGGEQVASGVYFYRLTAGETVLTKKMMLLK